MAATLILRSRAGEGNRRIAEAASDFAGASSLDELWGKLQGHMARLGFAGLIYGSAAVRTARTCNLLLSSFSRAYEEDKKCDGLMEGDYFFEAMYREVLPVLWGAPGIMEAFTELQKRSFEVDLDHGVITGVSIPMPFRDGNSVSAIGCHMPELSWAEFDRLWKDHGATVTTIVNAFDQRSRGEQIGAGFALLDAERDCLAWLAGGLSPKQISYHLGMSDSTVQRHIANARRRLKAATVPQAIATALVYGLIAP